ncbi:sulfurtransferase TusA family protein [Mannheimia sp. AT1]|uniref:Sulfurtransferase TusA family protein n=1 Tax=Mannheimia cairinae TaxID=3025936 RepID=A0ABT5MS31_9PAST|nr:sulfurtransferase TusA family protein [Mannheimia cairinae]MDD0823658.1 sulfurtransferase TusA family protein [Mannheimia cairinae]MDD0825410.1 sulfurtransferase TusA family protein [Mannheimia cairinae]
MQYSLDLTGYCCPLPLFMAKKAMDDLKKGDSLEILLNKQSSLADFELLVQENYFQIEIIEQAVKNKIIFTLLAQ